MDKSTKMTDEEIELELLKRNRRNKRRLSKDDADIVQDKNRKNENISICDIHEDGA